MFKTDIVVYGGTFAGVMAAERAANRGCNVIIVEPRRELGGVITGGLCLADLPQKGTIDTVLGGQTRVVFERLARYYGQTAPRRSFSPAYFAREMARIVSLNGVSVILQSPINGRDDVKVSDNRIEAIRTKHGLLYGTAFVDASYEGDLFAFAGVPYIVGRESQDEYGEHSAGFRESTARTVGGFSSNNVYPVGERPELKEGDADDAVQSYCFRGILSADDKRLPYPKPEAYDPADFRLVSEQIRSLGFTSFFEVIGSYPIPGGRKNWNSFSPISLDLIGRSQGYPEGDWATRQAIEQEHIYWNMGMLHYLANDPDVPEDIRREANEWGLPHDEFQDSPHGHGVPSHMYIRAARRMKGVAVLTENDLIANGVQKASRVCRYNYRRDPHVMRMYPGGEGEIVFEGMFPRDHKPVETYDLPAEILMPPERSIQNLTVPLNHSASHVAWCSSRMEPNMAMLGEACGELSAMLVDGLPAVQRYDYAQLASRLKERGSLID